MRLPRVLSGPEGHPLHPPPTDATIGAYTVATLPVASEGRRADGMRVLHLVDLPAQEATSPDVPRRKAA